MKVWGQSILSLVAVITSISPILADYNDTHLFNPLWLPHAKFHDGMSMSMGFGLGIIALWLIWRRSREEALTLRAASWVDALYWIAFIPSRMLPGTALLDPGREMPRPLGIHANFFLALVCMALTLIGYVLAIRGIAQGSASTAGLSRGTNT